MQAPFDNIVQHLFHQPSLQSVTVDELERMAQEHPYFAAAHFLLLKKMQQTAHPQFTDQLHKTTLYFNNPLWLQFLLQPETVQGFTVLSELPFIKEPEAPAIPVQNGAYAAPEASLPTPAAHEIESREAAAATAAPAEPLQHSAAAAPAGIMDVITEVFQDEAPVAPATHTPPAPAAVTNGAMSDTGDEAIGAASNEPAEQAGAMQEAAPNPIEVPAETVEEAPVPQDVWLPDQLVTLVNEQELQQGGREEAIAAGLPLQEEIPVSPAADTQVPVAEETTAAVENPEEADATEPVLPAADTQVPVVEETTAAVENPEEADATDAPAIDATAAANPLLKNMLEAPAAGSDAIFEPYHTVDYFASQGIKLSKLEPEAKDKLGRQLRSFTEWLKTMKRLPQASIDKILSENEESKVVADAIHSIENKEVITEAMAEVFEKQGMHEKAVEVYQKLSLLNPAKSTYFAAKIAILKH